MSVADAVSLIDTVSGDVTPRPRFESQGTWLGRRSFESSLTTRLNTAHWRDADDQSINVWLSTQLETVRARSRYEARQNSTILGAINTHASDIVGKAGPSLQVVSENDEYNRTLETVWREWFKAPTIYPNVSGAAWLKLCVRSLWKAGEFLAMFITDPDVSGPVRMRLRPLPARRLATPPNLAGATDTVMGIQFHSIGRPKRYWIHDPVGAVGTGNQTGAYNPVPPDMILHEFVIEEEEQARGIPWLNTALQPSADLRDYDDQVQDAARQMADQAALLYTKSPDAGVWTAPEQTEIERRQITMAPPGWEPFQYQASQPPVQYPEFRSERQRDLGRPVGMPLIITRLDSSKHNYSSARLDTQSYNGQVAGYQEWLSGSDRAVGTLSRLVDEIAREAQFSLPVLRTRPAEVVYSWTWPVRGHVDPQKEATAEAMGLQNLTVSLTGALAARGVDIETHIATLRRELELLEGLGRPATWLQDPSPVVTGTPTEVEANAE